MSSTNKARRPTFAGPGGTSVRGGAASKRSGAPPSVESSSRIRHTKYGGTSRTLLSSSSKKNVTAGSSDKGQQGLSKPPVQVFDETGHDVTPISLLLSDPNVVRKNQSNILAESSAATPTDLMSQASIYQMGTIGASTFGGGPFTRSVFSTSQSGRSTTGSLSDDLGEHTTDYNSWSDIKHKREEVKEELTESDLDKIVDISLTETETIWLLDMPDVSVCVESEEAEDIRSRNARYEEMLKNKIGNDRYMERGMNTFNEPPKIKSVQTSKVTYNDVGVNASNWDMYDTYENLKAIEAKAAEEEKQKIEEEGTVSRPVSVAQMTGEKGDTEKEGEQAGSTLVREDTKASMQRSGSRGTNMSSFAGTDSVFASKESGVTAVQEVDSNAAEEILNNENLKSDLMFMERLVNLNTYQPKQACYRELEVLKDVDRIEPKKKKVPTATLR